MLDCCDPSVVGLTTEDLCDDFDYTLTHQLARAAVAVGAEGILVPSATCLGNNLILFPKNRRKGSMLIARDAVDPRIYVNRAGVT